MATTTFFGFTIPDSGSGGYDAAMNGNLVDMDKEIYAAQNPLVWDENTSGRIDSATELMTFDGNVLLWD